MYLSGDTIIIGDFQQIKKDPRNASFKKISISRDLTIQQRLLYRNTLKELQLRTSEGARDLKIIYKGGKFIIAPKQEKLSDKQSRRTNINPDS